MTPGARIRVRVERHQPEAHEVAHRRDRAVRVLREARHGALRLRRAQHLTAVDPGELAVLPGDDGARAGSPSRVRPMPLAAPRPMLVPGGHARAARPGATTQATPGAPPDVSCATSR